MPKGNSGKRSSGVLISYDQSKEWKANLSFKQQDEYLSRLRKSGVENLIPFLQTINSDLQDRHQKRYDYSQNIYSTKLKQLYKDFNEGKITEKQIRKTEKEIMDWFSRVSNKDSKIYDKEHKIFQALWDKWGRKGNN